MSSIYQGERGTQPDCLDELLHQSALIDTVEVKTGNFDQEFRQELEHSGCRVAFPKRLVWKGDVVGFIWRITAPTETTWQVLRRWKWGRLYDMKLVRIDIAVDSYFASEHSAEKFKLFVVENVYLRWNKYKRFWNGKVFCWCDFEGKQRKLNRSLKVYQKREEATRVRLEFMLWNARAIRHYGLDGMLKPSGEHFYRTFDLRAFLSHQMVLKELDPYFVSKKVKRAVSQEHSNPNVEPGQEFRSLTRLTTLYKLRRATRGEHQLPMKRVEQCLLLELLPERFDAHGHGQMFRGELIRKCP